ncbi:MAG: penicillin-binding protein 2 [Alphaproteobacteria bacterium]|nr:penicillin-binding protein 2 [Alphaproteobacteria bacterium]
MKISSNKMAYPSYIHHRLTIDPLDIQIQRQLEISRTRLLVISAIFAIGFLTIGLRLVNVTLANSTDDLQKITHTIRNEPTNKYRADILDRNGIVVATSLPTASLYANPKQILNVNESIKKILEILPELNVKEINSKLTQDRNFVWIKRNLTPRQHYAINRLGLPGFYFKEEEHRVYPQGSLLAHIVGYTDIDNHGLAGLERAFDQKLNEEKNSIRLSLDTRLQYIMRDELAKTIKNFSAQGGVGIILDTTSHEVLSLVSLPDFDPNAPEQAPSENRFNRASLGVYEMGSTLKIFNTAMVLDKGIVSLNDVFDTSTPIVIDKFTIHDDHPQNRSLSVNEIFAYSSNIGSAKMALQAGAKTQYDFFSHLGLLKPLISELPEMGRPIFPKEWRPINMMTMAYGHGIAITPLHLINGVANIIGDGNDRNLTFILSEDSKNNQNSLSQIVKADTSEKIRNLMKSVVDMGTGKKAQTYGYNIGGKTGTANKQQGHGYDKESRISSFIGAFPIEQPRYTILIMVDEPKGNEASDNYATGGWVAAPTFNRVVSRIAPLLGILPNYTLPNTPNSLRISSVE